MSRTAIVTLIAILFLCATVNASPPLTNAQGGAAEASWGPLIKYPIEDVAECKEYKDQDPCIEKLCYQYEGLERDANRTNTAPEELFHWYNTKYSECYQADQAL